MIVMPLTGYLGSSFNKFGTRFWGLRCRSGLGRSGLRRIFFAVHDGRSAWILIALILLHVAGRAQTSVHRPRQAACEDAAVMS